MLAKNTNLNINSILARINSRLERHADTSVGYRIRLQVQWEVATQVIDTNKDYLLQAVTDMLWCGKYELNGWWPENE